MTRFVQPGPDLPDPYRSDPQLRPWLRRLLGADGHDGAQDLLDALAGEVAGPLRQAHHDAEAHPPTLLRYDAWGARVDLVQTAPGWEVLRQAAARHGLVGLAYDDDARRRWGAGARVVQHALLHLYGPESATFSCPVAMSDGAAALLCRPDVDPAVRDEWLPRLTSTDPRTSITSGQWMTESQGGSDVSRTDTVATPPSTGGGWRLHGEKWFCSAIDSPVAIALARPAGAGPGSRVLVPFLVPCRPGGPAHPPAAGIRLHRLKDKLGTRAVPTAEVGLTDVAAVPLGDPGRPGLARMMTLVVITRLHNAAAAAAGMRRGLMYATSYAQRRVVAGGLLRDNPLHRATLGTVAVDTAGAFALAAHAFALLGRAEAEQDEGACGELRLVAPLAKLTTARVAVAAASELVESFGGAGYVEDTGLPRLLRDAQVLPIWEGTTNVLSVDVLRALSAEPGAKPLLHRLDEAVDTLHGLAAGTPDRDVAAALTAAVPALSAARGRLAGQLDAAVADPRSAAVMAGARGLSLGLGYALTAALLVEHAGWAGAATDPGAGLLAALWTRRFLGDGDIAGDAHRHADTLLATG